MLMHRSYTAFAITAIIWPRSLQVKTLDIEMMAEAEHGLWVRRVLALFDRLGNMIPRGKKQVLLAA